MIEAKLIFEQVSLSTFTSALFSLSEVLRPSHYSVGEGEEGKAIENIDVFLDSLEKSREPLGFSEREFSTL